MKTLKNLVLLSLVMLLGTTAVLAQEQTGSIFGQVTTRDGAAIVGAKIIVSSLALIRPLSTTTNDRGSYVFPALPVGSYEITFEAEKYQTIKREDISLSIGAQLRVNAVLETGVVGEEVVTITGEAPLIDVKSTDTGMSISKEVFATLPKGRNFTSLVALAPGANNENIGGGLMIDGASISENVWVIDGVDVTSFYTGATTQNAVFEFVEEVQVRSGGYEAEFGGSMGGVVNVITRSGGNEFHGEGNLFYSADSLDGNRRPSLRINPFDDVTPEYITYDKDEYTTLEFGAGLGGYVLKDRIWFFASYMPYFDNITRNVKFRNADGDVVSTEPFDRDITRHQAAAKVSSQLTDNIRLSGSFTTDWQKRLGELPSLAGTSNPDDNWSEKGDKQPGLDIAANLDYTISDNLYFNFKGGYHRDDNKQLGGPDEVRWRMSGSMSQFDVSGIPSQYLVPSGWSNISSGYVRERDIRQKQNWSGDITFFTEGGGSHMFKGGVQYYRIDQDVSDAYQKDYILFYWGRTYNSNFSGISSRGTYGYYRVVTAHPGGYGTIAVINSTRYALFLQDSWGVSDKLTVNAGVRTEKEDIPSFSDLPEYSDPPVTFDFADKLAPRIGAAYDFFGDGRLKIFGNYGRYYDVMKLAMAEGSYGGFKWRDRYFALDTLEWWTIGGDVGPWPRSGNYPGQYYEEIDWRIPSFESTDPDLMPTGIDEFILGADYQLADNMALNVRGVHKRLVRTIEDVGVVTPHGEEYYTANPGRGFAETKRQENGLPGTPDAIRHYWALEMRLTKRMSNNWSGGASLVLSRLSGNYSGLASSDEFGRADPNVERYFDNWFAEYDASWNIADGLLPTDRRYVLKLYGTYTFDWGLTVGAYQTFQDGTPFSTRVDLNSFQGWYPYGRGDLGRLDTLFQTDLYAEYNFKLGDYSGQFNVNVINLFNQDIALRRYYRVDRDGPKMTDEELLALYNSRTPINVPGLMEPYTTIRYDPRFGKDYTFQSPITVRLGVKFFF